jgi:Cdc6-like AAA superfamily ATPase
MIGNTGYGKTSLCRLASLAYPEFLWGFADWNPKMPRQSLLILLSSVIKNSVGFDEVPKQVQKIRSRIERYRNHAVHYITADIARDIERICNFYGKKAVLVMDNFYTFSQNTVFFDTILSDLATSNNTSVIVVSKPACIEELKRESMGLYQRLTNQIELNRFTDDELREIIKTRVQAAWIKKKTNEYHPFTSETADILVENSDGNARDLILFCQEAIRIALKKKLTLIDEKVAEKVVIKLQKSLLQRVLFTLHPKAIQILKHLVKNKGSIDMKSLHKELNVKSNGAISYYIDQLINLEIIERKNKGKYLISNFEEIESLLKI